MTHNTDALNALRVPLHCA